MKKKRLRQKAREADLAFLGEVGVCKQWHVQHGMRARDGASERALRGLLARYPRISSGAKKSADGMAYFMRAIPK
jgi:hypothetical protein